MLAVRFNNGLLHLRNANLRSCARLRAHRALSTLPDTPLFKAIAQHDPSSTAIVHSQSGRQFSYGQLLKDVLSGADTIRQTLDKSKTSNGRVAVLTDNTYDYVVNLLSVWASSSVAIPLSSTFPSSELQYILENSESNVLLATARFSSMAEETLENSENKISLIKKDKSYEDAEVSKSQLEVSFAKEKDGDNGMLLYTSGTTSKPKGVILPNAVLAAQSESLRTAWKFTPNDRLLHVLPLHHIHGTLNGLLTPLLAGSEIEFLYHFNAEAVWKRLAAPFTGEKAKPISVFTAVPTIYSRLLDSHPQLPKDIQNASKTALSRKNMRLNMCGSAALQSSVKRSWAELSGGNDLLERYGMTEVGMALSCGLDFNDRIDNSVGWPLPLVKARLVDTETHKEVIISKEDSSMEGEIHVSGPTVFKGYWKNPEATEKEFVTDEAGESWFRTGDVASLQAVESAGESGSDWAHGPMFFIKGRASVDIIKTGGEKVSALEVERELLSLPQVQEVAVVGLPSEKWGERVAAAIVLAPGAETAGRGGKPWGVMDMRRALKDQLVNYKIPQVLKVVPDSLPRNAMGKVNKKALLKDLFAKELAQSKS